jgi:hypothetical protein
MSLQLLFMLMPAIAVFNAPHASLTKTPDDQFIMWWHRSLQRDIDIFDASDCETRWVMCQVNKLATQFDRGN